jgi:hypothetical protein
LFDLIEILKPQAEAKEITLEDNTCRLKGKGEGERGKKKPLTFTL